MSYYDDLPLRQPELRHCSLCGQTTERTDYHLHCIACWNDDREQRRQRAEKESAGKPSSHAVVVRTDPVLEAIARKLSGIACVPPTEQAAMIRRAAKAGAQALREQNASAQAGAVATRLKPVVGSFRR